MSDIVEVILTNPASAIVEVTVAEAGGGAAAIGDITGLQEALDDLGTEIDGKAAAVHTHAIADVTGLQTALDGKAASIHTHAIGDVTGLQTALNGKASSVHTHAIADVTGLQTALDGKAASSHSHADATTGAAGFMTAAMVTKLAAQQAAASVASGATAAIGGLAEVVTITGTTGITSFGASTEGERHLLIFAGVVTLTHSTALSLPGAANFTTQAGDRLTIRGTTAGWAVDPFYVRGGLTTMIGAVNASGAITAGSHLISSNGDVFASASGALGFTGRAQHKSQSTASMDLLASDGSTMATLRAMAVAGRAASGSNVAGQDLTVSAGAGTGNNTPGRILHRVSPPGSSGSTVQTLRDQMIIAYTGVTTRAGQSTQFHRHGGNIFTDAVPKNNEFEGSEFNFSYLTLLANLLANDGDRLVCRVEFRVADWALGLYKVVLNGTTLVEYSGYTNTLNIVETELRRVNGTTVRSTVREVVLSPVFTPQAPLREALDVSFDGSTSNALYTVGVSDYVDQVKQHCCAVDFFPANV